MPKEVKDNRESSGGEDGLDQAAEHSSGLDDEELAKLFIQANKEAQENEGIPLKELFSEERKVFNIPEYVPSKEEIKEIEESLLVKDIHHKKLLEEGVPSNLFLRFWYKIKSFFQVEVKQKSEFLTPESWGLVSVFWKLWKRETSFYLSNFGSLIDLHLRNDQKIKQMLKREILFMLFLMSISIPGLIRFHTSSTFMSTWREFIFSTSVLACIFSTVPFFFFLALWFVNVNRLHASRNFHFFVFSSFTIASVFALLSLFNLILSFIFESRIDF